MTYDTGSLYIDTRHLADQVASALCSASGKDGFHPEIRVNPCLRHMSRHRHDRLDRMGTLFKQMTGLPVLRRVTCVTHDDQKVDGASDDTENEQYDCYEDKRVSE